MNTDKTCSSVFPNEKTRAEVDRVRVVSAYSSQLGQGWCLWRQREEEGVSEEGEGSISPKYANITGFREVRRRLGQEAPKMNNLDLTFTKGKIGKCS